MKTILSLMLGLATAAGAQTNESVFFSAHLTGSMSYTANGMFSLTDNLFTYRLITPFGFEQAAIYGPALLGTDGPLLFGLQLTGCQAPAEDREGFCGFGLPLGTGTFTLSEQQAGDLLGGLWYVRSVSPTAPSFPIRGQILQVPEPSVFSIVLAAGVSVVGLKRALTRGGRRRTAQAVQKSRGTGSHSRMLR